MIFLFFKLRKDREKLTSTEAQVKQDKSEKCHLPFVLMAAVRI